MGLIHKVEQKINAPLVADEPASFIKKKTGLLDKITKSCSYDLILNEFKELLVSVGAQRGGLVFFDNDHNSSLLFPQGLDITSVRRFCPKESFFKKNSTDQDWNIFTVSNLDIFFPYFSSHEKDSLEKIYLKQLFLSDGSHNFWLLLIESKLDTRRDSLQISQVHSNTISEVIKNNFRCIEILFPISHIPLSKNAVAERVKSACSSDRVASLLHISLSSIFKNAEQIHSDAESMLLYNGLVQQIKKKVGLSNIVHIDTSNNIRLVVFSSQKIDYDLYIHQLMQPLKELFGLHRISLITFDFSGSTQSVQDIINFIDGQ